MTSSSKCHITNLVATPVTIGPDVNFYFIEFNKKRIGFKFHWDYENSEFVKATKYILKGLILNDKFPMEYLGIDGGILDNEVLEKIVNESMVPHTPQEKINSLLEYLHSIQEYEGATIDIPELNSDILANKLYFKNHQELHFYLFSLRSQNLIEGKTFPINPIIMVDPRLTYQGLGKVIQIQESGRKSNRCFIAMSFSDGNKDLRETLKTAIKNTGYTPIVIDEIHYESHKTINDAIIAEIRKCKFMVAEFTEHKHGVYFEAGFALGLNKPVIYACNQDDFKNTHFDTKHYPHIIYAEHEELRRGLEDKINAWIVK